MTHQELKNKLREKLEDIADVLCDSIDEFSSTGVLGGISGLALFMFYYSRFTNESKYAEIGGQAIEKAVKMVNNGYTLHTFCSGVSGLAWTCEHLVQQRFIEREDISFLDDLKPYLMTCMEKNFQNGDYDFLHGGLGVGYYFITNHNTDTKALKMLLNCLEQTSEKMTDGSRKWKSVINSETNQIGYNICLSHGMASIAACLSKLIKCNNIFSDEVIPLLSGVVSYILNQKFSMPSHSYFPSHSLESDPHSRHSRLGWCYGDLGIAYSILMASKIMGKKDWNHFAIKVFTHNCNRKDGREFSVCDAGLCHGSSGVAHIFYKLYLDTKMEVFNETAKYWYQKTLEFSVFGDECAGYKRITFPDGKEVWETDFGLLTGIVGIGLGIMPYLNQECMSWDECLLLS